MWSSGFMAHCALVVLVLSLPMTIYSEATFPPSRPNFVEDFVDEQLHKNLPRQAAPEQWRGWKPLRITNGCADTLWPAVLTQYGAGPGTGGFQLEGGASTNLWVGPDWQGRVWGRTNCTVNGDTASCDTGGCFSKLECEFAGDLPATLAEFTLAGGIANQQNFYDISLVDGYNLPMSIRHIPARNTTFIPPNLTNLACIATPGYLAAAAPSGIGGTGVYGNSSSKYAVPWEYQVNDAWLRDWCPWPLLANPPNKPGDGVYPYPDDQIWRPDFSPCLSQCAATGRDEDCCAGVHGQPDRCSPSVYSMLAKSACPDAYSYAYDDQSSTFIIPGGGGWEILFCPEGRSTNILSTLGEQLSELAANGMLIPESAQLVADHEYIRKRSEEAAAPGLDGERIPWWGVVVAMAIVSLAC